MPRLAATPVGVSPICFAAFTPVTSACPAPVAATSPLPSRARTAGLKAFSLELITLIPSLVSVTASVTKSFVLPIAFASSPARDAAAPSPSPAAKPARNPRPTAAFSVPLLADGEDTPEKGMLESSSLMYVFTKSLIPCVIRSSPLATVFCANYRIQVPHISPRNGAGSPPSFHQHCDHPAD